MDLVLTCGGWAEYISRAARAHRPQTDAWHYRRLAYLVKALKSYFRRGDVILVKGSRGMRMERVTEALRSGLQ